MIDTQLRIRELQNEHDTAINDEHLARARFGAGMMHEYAAEEIVSRAMRTQQRLIAEIEEIKTQ